MYKSYLNHEVVLGSYRVDLQLVLILRDDRYASVYCRGCEWANLDWGAAGPEVDGEGEVGQAILETSHRRWDGS